MSVPGPVALLGGGEHRAGCELIDRWLLDRTGRAQPGVVVVPAASPPGNLPATAALARTWWQGLGAGVSALHPAALTGPAAVSALAHADLIVLTGGVPDRLVAALGAGPTWDLVLDRWRDGAVLAGSSAGAMALFAWRLGLRPLRPLRVVPGLGPLEGHVAVPHFDRLVTRAGLDHWVARRQRRFDDLAVLGIDERTALVVDGDDVLVRGLGAVTVLDGAHRSAARAGAPVTGPRPLLRRAQVMSRRRAPTMPADVSAAATAVSDSNGTQVRSAAGNDGTWVNGDRFSTHWSSWSTGPSWPISR